MREKGSVNFEYSRNKKTNKKVGKILIQESKKFLKI